MKKKTTHYEFKNPNFQIYCVSQLGKPNDLCDEDVLDVSDDISISPDIKELLDDYMYEFIDSLYKFCLNYNETFKKLRMKKEHQCINYMTGGLQSPMDIYITIKNGVGKFSYSPFNQWDSEHEKKMWGTFKIEKEDMMKFINDFSKKVEFQFNPNTELRKFKRVGNWYYVKVGNTKYNVIIQKSSNSYDCEPSSVIIFDEEHKLIEPHKDKKNIYDKIESMMNKVDFKYDVVDED